MRVYACSEKDHTVFKVVRHWMRANQARLCSTSPWLSPAEHRPAGPLPEGFGYNVRSYQKGFCGCYSLAYRFKYPGHGVEGGVLNGDYQCEFCGARCSGSWIPHEWAFYTQDDVQRPWSRPHMRITPEVAAALPRLVARKDWQCTVCKRKTVIGGSFIGEQEGAHARFTGVTFIPGVTKEPEYSPDWMPPFHNGVEAWTMGKPYYADT